MRFFLVGRVMLKPVVRSTDAQVEMLALELGEGRALAFFEFLHRVEMRHLHERRDELEIGRPVIRLRHDLR